MFQWQTSWFEGFRGYPSFVQCDRVVVDSRVPQLPLFDAFQLNMFKPTLSSLTLFGSSWTVDLSGGSFRGLGAGTCVAL